MNVCWRATYIDVYLGGSGISVKKDRLPNRMARVSQRTPPVTVESFNTRYTNAENTPGGDTPFCAEWGFTVK